MTQVTPFIATKRPTTVEAMRFYGDNEDNTLAIVDWVNGRSDYKRAEKHPYENMITLGRDFDVAKPGEWIIRDQFNDFWPLPDNVFRAVYDAPY